MTLLILSLCRFATLFNIAIEPNFLVSTWIPIFRTQRHEGSGIQSYFIWNLFDAFDMFVRSFWFWLIEIKIKFERLGVVNFKRSFLLFLNTRTYLSFLLNSLISLAVRNIWWISISFWWGSHITCHFLSPIKLLERWNLLWPLDFRPTPFCLNHVHKLRVESDLRPLRSNWGLIDVLFLWEFVSLVYFAFSESFLNFNFVLSELQFYFSVLRVMVLFFREESFRSLVTVLSFAFISPHILLLDCGLRNSLCFVHIIKLWSFKVRFLLFNKGFYPFR